MQESQKKKEIPYTLIYSVKRRTIGISVKELKVIVRAPIGTKSSMIKRVLDKHAEWIEKSLMKQREALEKRPALDGESIAELKAAAKEYFATQTERFAKTMGLKYGRITITSAEKRYGSCSSKGNICFSYRLMLCPCEFREYVIVHELCHLVYMNHSREFYKLVEKYMPDYKQRRMLVK